MSIACVSGYFDPIHVGDIEYFKKSKNIADKISRFRQNSL